MRGRRSTRAATARSPTPASGCPSSTSTPGRWPRRPASTPPPTDVVRYFSAHFLGDERLLTDASKRRMQQALWDTGVDHRSYGLGLAITYAARPDRDRPRRRLPRPHHLDDGRPQARFAVSVLTNAIDGPAEECVLAAIHLLDLALEGPGANPELQRFTGRFADLWGVVDVALLGGRLFMLRPTVADPADKPMPLEVVDDTTLRIAGGQGFGSYGEPVSYDFRDDGTIRSIRADSGLRHVPLDEYVAAAAGDSGPVEDAAVRQLGGDARSRTRRAARPSAAWGRRTSGRRTSRACRLAAPRPSRAGSCGYQPSRISLLPGVNRCVISSAVRSSPGTSGDR